MICIIRRNIFTSIGITRGTGRVGQGGKSSFFAGEDNSQDDGDGYEDEQNYQEAANDADLLPDGRLLILDGLFRQL